MIRNVILVLLLLKEYESGWVKIANFYSPTPLHPLLTSLHKTNQDLNVVAVNTELQEVRIPLHNAPYYQLSHDWSALNGSTYFGRLGVFTKNYANQDVEHNILKFQGNATVKQDDYAVMSLVRNKQEFSGYLCNLGEMMSRKRALVNICLHNITEYSNINTSQIKIIMSKSDCSDCNRYKVHPHMRSGGLEFSVPESGGKEKWNVTVQYTQHTTLCRFEGEISPNQLNLVIMKQNLTVDSMFECVLYSVPPLSSNMDKLTPVIAGLVSVVILGIAVTVFYYKCDRHCLRQLIPTPDQDTAAAPYRSFNSSNQSRDSPDSRDNNCIDSRDNTRDNYYTEFRDNTDNGYNNTDNGVIKMRELDSKSRDWSSGHSSGQSSRSVFSKQSEPHYERI